MIDRAFLCAPQAPRADRRTLRRAGFAALLALACGAFAVPTLATATGSMHPSTETPDLLSMFNRDRMDSRMPRLSVHTDLAAIAQEHAVKMAAKHRLFFMDTPVTELPPSSTIAEWEGDAHTLDAFHQATLDSDPHRRVLLGDFEDIGVGVARGRNGKIYVAVLMRRPEPD